VFTLIVAHGPELASEEDGDEQLPPPPRSTFRSFSFACCGKRKPDGADDDSWWNHLCEKCRRPIHTDVICELVTSPEEGLFLCNPTGDKH